MATSIRLSRTLGEQRRELLRPIGFGALGFSSAVMLVFAVVFMTGGAVLARGFTADGAVIALAAQLLTVAALFQLFDGGQVVASGALRGLADVQVPTVITFVAYWLVSLPVAYLLAFRLGLGPVGIWLGLASGLLSAALLLNWRFYRKSAARL
jgi:MATE family multidrug resistance protein